MNMKVSILGESVPSLPSEKDESIDASDVVVRKVMRQAATDIAKGLKDTDRGDQVDKIYRKLKTKK
jgi:hypothetical protein